MQPFSLDCPHPDRINDPAELQRSLERGEMYMLLGGLPPHVSPLPQKESLLKAYVQYAKRGGGYPIPNWATCEAWAWFRNAVISQGIAARVAQKQASSAQAKMYATKFPAASEAVRTIIRRSGAKLPEAGEAKAKL